MISKIENINYILFYFVAGGIQFVLDLIFVLFLILFK